MKPETFMLTVIEPAMAENPALPGEPACDSEQALCLLLAIAMQESALDYRRQLGEDGKPLTRLARGYWQFEKGGGVKGVMTHPKSAEAARNLCQVLDIPFDVDSVHEAIAWNDDLAVGFARLLLWTDPAPLPAIGDQAGAWEYYLKLWRPGKPHPDRWAVVYPQAVAALNVTPITLATTTPEQPAMTHLSEERIDAIVRAAMSAAAVQVEAPAPAPAAPVTPPGQLTVEAGGRSIVVTNPTMNRSWKTGEWWLGMLSIVGPVLVMLSPLIDPALEQLASNPALAASPIAGALIYIARSIYKGWRVSVAASVAKAEVKA